MPETSLSLMVQSRTLILREKNVISLISLRLALNLSSEMLSRGHFVCQRVQVASFSTSEALNDVFSERLISLVLLTVTTIQSMSNKD